MGVPLEKKKPQAPKRSSDRLKTVGLKKMLAQY